MNIADFRKKHLSNEIINAMQQATEAFAEMNAVIRLSPNMDSILYDALLASHIQYQNPDEEIGFIDTLHSVCIRSGENFADKHAQIMNTCTAYAKERTQVTEVLTAGDLLKINYAFETCDTEILKNIEAPFHLIQFIEPTWAVLHDLYSPKRHYPLLLEMAIAFYRLITLSISEGFHLPTITVLLSAVYKNDLAFLCIVREWVLSTDPRTIFSALDAESAITHILSVLEKTWRYTTLTLYTLRENIPAIPSYIQEAVPNIMSTGIATIMTKQICIRNRDVVEQLKVTAKTAIGYLKQLEQQGLLRPAKLGREKYYFNTVICDALQRIDR